MKKAIFVLFVLLSLLGLLSFFLYGVNVYLLFRYVFEDEESIQSNALFPEWVCFLVLLGCCLILVFGRDEVWEFWKYLFWKCFFGFKGFKREREKKIKKN